jgi:hypothetical protein
MIPEKVRGLVGACLWLSLLVLSGCFDSGNSSTQFLAQCEGSDLKCEGDVAYDCLNSDKSFSKTIVRTNCADTGQVCLYTPGGSNNEPRATCVLSTETCQGSDAYCDGELLFGCTSGGYLDSQVTYEDDSFERHVSLIEDCGQYRQSCFEDGQGGALCAVDQETCDADSDPPRCDDERAVRCIGGRWVATDDCSRPSRECELFGDCQDITRVCVVGEQFSFCEEQ